MTRRLRVAALELWLPVLLIAAWWLASARSTSMFFPPLRSILRRFEENWLFARVSSDLLPSLGNLVIGYAVAVAVGVAGGVLLGSVAWLRTAAGPLLEFLRALPAVALLPIALVAFGIGTEMKVFVIAFGALWPVLLNTMDGVRNVDPLLRDMTKCFRMSPAFRLRWVILPAAAQQILAGCRVSMSIAVVLIVVSEMAGSSSGLGYFVLASQRSFAITDMWTGMVLLGIVGYALNLAFRAVEARLLRWHPSHRPTAAT